MPRYAFDYAPHTVYENVVGLAGRHFAPHGLIVDVGCGHGAVAEPLRDLGFRYLGVDVDETGLKDLADRGFDTAVCDLSKRGALAEVVAEHLGEQALAGLLLIDCLEHVYDGVSALEEIRAASAAAGSAPLVISVPNVTHVDLGIKLLMGRWDYTKVGLLDDTHVAFFDEKRLAEVTGAAGWGLAEADDFLLFESDQHFPKDAVTLTPSTPVSALLRRLRDGSGPGCEVNQWVRAYVPTRARVGDPAAGNEPADAPFLSVLTRTQGDRLGTLQETLLCLAAQHSDDFEVLLLMHGLTPSREGDLRYLVQSLPEEFAKRVRLIPVTGGGRCRPLNVGVVEARGRYIAVLDDDDLVLAHWVETFKQLGTRWPGRVLRTGVASQDIELAEVLGRSGSAVPVSEITTPYPLSFDLFDHIRENFSPPCGLAFPRSLFRDLGVRYDESLSVLEDWDVLLQAAPLCGVADSQTIAAIYRRWQTGENSSTLHSASEWAAAHQAIIAKLDNHVHVFPRGSLARVRTALAEAHDANGHVASAARQITAMTDDRNAHAVALAEVVGDNETLRARVHHLETVITQEREQQAADLEQAAVSARVEGRSERDQALSEMRDSVRREFFSSTSWRVTGPLRRASRLARKAKNR